MSKSTSLCQQIVQQLDRKVSWKTVASKYSWASLSLEDRECLWEEAEQRSIDPEGSGSLLYAIYSMTMMTNKYPWDELRALALILQLPDDVFPLPNKEDGLTRMSRVLDRIRGTLSGGDKPGIQRFMQYKADYCALRAHVLLKSEKTSHAAQSYKEALAIYQEYGLEERASQMRREIAHLKAVEKGQHLLPLDRLASERLRLQETLSKLRADVEAERQRLSDFQATLEKAQAERDSLTQEIEDKIARLQTLNPEYERSLARVEELVKHVRRLKSALYFLTALPRAAMAPLWVEVVRLALDQGEIDELTRQALERLALDLPEDAVPLLAEIAARSPEPFAVDAKEFQSKTTRGLALMAKARQLKEKQQDLSAAAEVLVEAWDMLLASGEMEK